MVTMAGIEFRSIILGFVAAGWAMVWDENKTIA